MTGALLSRKTKPLDFVDFTKVCLIKEVLQMVVLLTDGLVKLFHVLLVSGQLGGKEHVLVVYLVVECPY